LDGRFGEGKTSLNPTGLPNTLAKLKRHEFYFIIFCEFKGHGDGCLDLPDRSKMNWFRMCFEPRG